MDRGGHYRRDEYCGGCKAAVCRSDFNIPVESLDYFSLL